MWEGQWQSKKFIKLTPGVAAHKLPLKNSNAGELSATNCKVTAIFGLSWTIQSNSNWIDTNSDQIPNVRAW